MPPTDSSPHGPKYDRTERDLLDALARSQKARARDAAIGRRLEQSALALQRQTCDPVQHRVLDGAYARIRRMNAIIDAS